MPTKTKVTVSSLILVLLLACLAWLSYQSLGNVSGQFAHVERGARFNAYSSAIAADLNRAGANAYRYMAHRQETDLSQGRAAVNEAQKYIDQARELAITGETQHLLTRLGQDVEAFDSLLGGLWNGAQAENGPARLDALLETIAVHTGALTTAAASGVAEAGKAGAAAGAAAMRNLALISAAVLALAVLLALYGAVSLTRTLRRIARFAGEISHGGFSRDPAIHEKGDVGEIVTAMRRIPEALDSLIKSGGGLAESVRSGRFRDRIEASAFEGSYGVLGHAINAVSDAYTSVLDSQTAPIMTADRNLKVLFLNKAAQAVIGGDHTGASCSSLLHASSCDTCECFGAKVMESGAIRHGEVTMNLPGKELIAHVTGTPLRDSQQRVVGFMEAVTDLTYIREQENTMLRVADEASRISDRVAAAAEELAAQIELISTGAERQRRQVESTAGAMNQMNATVIEVAGNAAEAARQGESARQKAREGASLVDQVVCVINSVNEVAVSLQGDMHELGDKAVSIGGVMNVISDIADQTNLLALNAAIEAARAGEAGRGFAVVADEVRKLAEKTMQATHEVGSNITAIQQAAKTNIEEVNSAVARIREASALTASSGDALSKIVDFATANASTASSIATAAEQQSAASEQISRAITDINQVVAQTADGMIQSSAAVQELSDMAHRLKRVMEGLKQAV